jgi:uncharacterized RmlC-like cupin family protein
MRHTTLDPIITRTGKEAVTFDLTHIYHTTIIIPTNSIWTTGFHWHETHAEYLKVLLGSMRVRLGNTWSLVSAGTTVHVEQYVRHEWTRADPYNGPDLIVEESMDPADAQKSVFFWAINGLISENLHRTDSGRERVGETLRMYLGVFAGFWYMDNIPVIVDARWEGEKPGWIGWTASHAVLAIASCLNLVFGRPVVDDKAMPKEVWDAWRKGFTQKEQ